MTQALLQAGAESQEPQAVAGVPRLFVGQVPTELGEADLLPVFAPYGTIEKVTLVRGPEGKSRGCAMVQFKRWAEAEAAMDAVSGSSPLEGGKGRPLVVHFANPRRTLGNQMAEASIAPRKLFVGQIPKTAGEAEILAVFAPYGEVEAVNVLKSKGIHAGCAFVQYAKWASCEAAIEGLHEAVVMPGCEHPLVVKFADAKRSDGALAQKRAMSMSMMGGMMMGGPLPMMGGSYMADMATMGMPAMSHMALSSMAMPGMAAIPGMSGLMGGSMGPSGMGMPIALTSALGGMASKPYGLSHSDGNSSDGIGGDGATETGSVVSGLATPDQGPPGPVMSGMHGSGSMGNLQAMQANLMAGMSPYGPMGVESGMHMMNGMMMGAQRGKLGRGVADPEAYAHKLFIGQIPFEASEQDLWALFAPLGDVLELAILRSQGRSKGCAFLTYASRAQAAVAINAFNGRQLSHSKKLVVKFADQKA